MLLCDDTTEEDRPIASKFIRDEFQWDRMSEVNWPLLRDNLAAADRVLENPTKFPRADFEAVEERAFELTCFLASHLEL